MPFVFDQISVQTPGSYELEEATLVLGAPPSAGGESQRRVNLIVRTVQVAAKASEEEVYQQAAASLQAAGQSMLSAFSNAPFVFADQREGQMLSFLFGFKTTHMRQFHAMRKDGQMLTTLVLTVDPKDLTPAREAALMKSLASAVWDG